MILAKKYTLYVQYMHEKRTERLNLIEIIMSTYREECKLTDDEEQSNEPDEKRHAHNVSRRGSLHVTCLCLFLWYK